MLSILPWEPAILEGGYGTGVTCQPAATAWIIRHLGTQYCFSSFDRYDSSLSPMYYAVIAA